MNWLPVVEEQLRALATTEDLQLALPRALACAMALSATCDAFAKDAPAPMVGIAEGDTFDIGWVHLKTQRSVALAVTWHWDEHHVAADGPPYVRLFAMDGRNSKHTLQPTGEQVDSMVRSFFEAVRP